MENSHSWITPADEEYVRATIPDFVGFDSATEFSQSSIVKLLRNKAPPLFFKKSCVKLLQEKSPRNPDSKWRVTQTSFRNEHLFLGDDNTLNKLRAIGVLIPQVVALQHDGDPLEFDTVFRTITEWLDLEHSFLERPTYSVQETERVFLWLARFHAFFWDNIDSPFCERLSKLGGWWRKPLRPTVKWDILPATFDRLAKEFPEEFQGIHKEKAMEALAKMANIAKNDGFSKLMGPMRTLIHGDVKCTNFFLSRKSEETIAIDFQWTGAAASGVGDLVYFFFGGVTSFPAEGDAAESLLQFDQRMRSTENHLRGYYYRYFCESLGSTSKFSESEFEDQYDLELLEYFTTAVPYLLSDLTPKIARKNLKKYGFLTYEFDPRFTAFFVRRALEAFAKIRAKDHVT